MTTVNNVKTIKPKNKSYRQGYFRPDNPEKYVGDVNNIVFRSSWEKTFMSKWCDHNEKVIKWCSEEIHIPYYSPIDGKMHKYWVDFWAVLLVDGVKHNVLVEIKPFKQLSPPKQLNESTATLHKLKSYNDACKTYVINRAKWQAAKEFAEQRKMRFIIVTEKDLYK